jgi:hypothetical protein
MCGGRALTNGPGGIEPAPVAAAPTDLPQSMQYRDSGVFVRPQNAQTVKLEPPGNTPVRRVNIRRGHCEEQ